MGGARAPSGQAPTAQGEAVRISGRLSYELLDNGGINWDEAYESLVDGLGVLLASGTPLPSEQLGEAQWLLTIVRTAAVDKKALYRISELVVEWVGLNPEVMPNPLPFTGR
ncbi:MULTISPECIES: hypothetical protein [unclassified Actinomyces]|uniref:hypothetical protein n=1 Tax=unclassified Actinomyces TaxID=2609248 RepID=UPI002017E5C4|nr:MULTISPECIES: hypothetical protein [unclassified Actinomyces]MCL3776604.1 hypothetical protein [Actinomyces sp. AC-20-1]MCL3788890.1 hypothetical protein [Actinomyces sp. 187325]MCL3791004.1 hypothetical protein [Actinomyces sp. 186855]MCL3793470.1 hypothetical protein [Actinomyces sp. 217892]